MFILFSHRLDFSLQKEFLAIITILQKKNIECAALFFGIQHFHLRVVLKRHLKKWDPLREISRTENRGNNLHTNVHQNLKAFAKQRHNRLNEKSIGQLMHPIYNLKT